MALYKMYYSTINHIREYETFEEKKRTDGIKLSDKTVEEPAIIKVVDDSVLNEIKKVLRNKLLKHEINEKQYKEMLKDMKTENARERFDKIEIDAFTSIFKNEQQLISNLAKSDINGETVKRASKNGRKNKIVVVYKHENIKELDTIYNNPLLHKIAIQFINRKKNGDRRDNIVLADNIKNDYYKYTSIVKEYLKQAMYNKALTKKYQNSARYNPLHKQFKTAVENYAIYSRDLERKVMIGDESENIELSREIEHYSDEIDKLMLNYNIFRDVALWEQNIRQNKMALEELEQFNASKEIMDDLRNRIIKAGEIGGKDKILKDFSLNEINSMSDTFLEKYKINIKKIQREQEKEENHQLSLYENDIIYDYYNTGGSEAVINNMDIDDLVNYPISVLEDVGINIDGLGLTKDGDQINNGKTR